MAIMHPPTEQAWDVKGVQGMIALGKSGLVRTRNPGTCGPWEGVLWVLFGFSTGEP